MVKVSHGHFGARNIDQPSYRSENMKLFRTQSLGSTRHSQRDGAANADSSLQQTRWAFGAALGFALRQAPTRADNMGVSSFEGNYPLGGDPPNLGLNIGFGRPEPWPSSPNPGI